MSEPISRDALTRIRNRLNDALASIAKDEGLAKFEAGRCTFDRSGGFVFKVEGVAKGGLSREENCYEQMRAVYPTLPALKAEIDLRGRRGVVLGCTTTGKKVIIRHVEDGKQYLYRTQDIASLGEKKK